MDTIATEMAWIGVTPDGLVVEEIAPGLTLDDVRNATAAQLIAGAAIKEMTA